MSNNWYVITGSLCSGKTSVIRELEKRGYTVAHEVARTYFLEELEKGRTLEEVRGDVGKVQEEIIRRGVAVEKGLNPEDAIFFDRAIPDSRAFLALAGVPETDDMRQTIDAATYRKVFVLHTLPYEEDGIRVETPEEQVRLHDLHLMAYSGSEIIEVPVMPLEERVSFILSKLD